MVNSISDMTVGYDSYGLSELQNNVHTEIIDTATTDMKQNLEQLLEAVRQVWSGNAESIFEQNMELDVKEITEAINNSYEKLLGEFAKLQNKIAEFDENLVKDID